MKRMRTDFSGIWPLVEEFQLREKAKELGYRLQKDRSKTEMLVWVMREFARATYNLRYFLFSTFIVASDWKIVISIFSVFGSLQVINKVFRQKK